ncbi:MAG: class II aldolase/adducin family protein, partial [Acidobacteria bacterium]|nr:class II aldolase/adducin family protein [Acidobacteriota bacterium]
MSTRGCVIGCGMLMLLTSSALAQNSSTPAGGAAPRPSQLEELVLANQILSNEGVLDAYGHVSVRDERNPNQFLLARAIAAGSVTAADIITYDLDSNPVGDKRPGFSERFIHGQIYKARPDVTSVVHFHAADVIPFTVSAARLRPMIHMAGFLPPVTPIFEIRTFGGLTDMLVRSNELGKGLADTLGDKPVVLLRGHRAAGAAPTH